MTDDTRRVQATAIVVRAVAAHGLPFQWHAFCEDNISVFLHVFWHLDKHTAYSAADEHCHHMQLVKSALQGEELIQLSEESLALPWGCG